MSFDLVSLMRKWNKVAVSCFGDERRPKPETKPEFNFRCWGTENLSFYWFHFLEHNPGRKSILFGDFFFFGLIPEFNPSPHSSFTDIWLSRRRRVRFKPSSCFMCLHLWWYRSNPFYSAVSTQCLPSKEQSAAGICSDLTQTQATWHRATRGHYKRLNPLFTSTCRSCRSWRAGTSSAATLKPVK